MEAATDKVESASAWEVKNEKPKETYEVNNPVSTAMSTEGELSQDLHLNDTPPPKPPHHLSTKYPSMPGNLSRTPPQLPKNKIIYEVKNILNISSLFKFSNIFCELTPRLRNV